jgi:hypothetical protein
MVKVKGSSIGVAPDDFAWVLTAPESPAFAELRLTTNVPVAVAGPLKVTVALTLVPTIWGPVGLKVTLADTPFAIPEPGVVME